MNTPNIWKVLEYMKRDQVTGTWKVQLLKTSHRTPPQITPYLLHFKFHRLPALYNSKSLNVFNFPVCSNITENINTL